MSIQETKNKKFIYRLIYKLKLIGIIDKIFQYNQKLFRNKYKQNYLNIFFPYYTNHTHPYIRERWYKNNSPVIWSTDKRADLIHVLSYPSQLLCNRPLIIEPNDQILTLCAYFGAHTPSQCLEKISEVKKFIAQDRLKAILVGNDGLIDQFKYYFGNDFLHKLIIYPQMRCLPRFTYKTLSKKLENIDGGINFLFLASSYSIKAVEIVFNAWKLKVPENSNLTIVCSDIPENTLTLIKEVPSITIIEKAPLNSNLKHKLMDKTSVSISVSHVDGGANAWEGIEYGHAIITNDNHRGEYLVGNGNGIIVPFKNKFYDLGRYGIEWDSLEEYMNIVKKEFKNGQYEESINKLSDAFILLSSNQELLKKMRIRSIEYAWSQSVQNSNLKLLEIYTNALA